jgi:hypothetical protein
VSRPEELNRLEELNIQRVGDGPSFSIYVRENCIGVVAAAGSANSGALNQGSTGLMTEQGLAYLIWREGQPYLAAKGGEVPATPEQLESIRKFSQDLETALGTPPDAGVNTTTGT